MTEPCLTIVTPSFEKHYVQFSQFVASIDRYCTDKVLIELVVVVESVNEISFAELLARFPSLRARIILTEDVLKRFNIADDPYLFLKKVGKFTFQSIKKFGGLVDARSDWSLVLDSETLFHKPFSAKQILVDYTLQKYVFYTNTAPRGRLWRESTAYQVTNNAAAALRVPPVDRWYMEYFHWFYETDKLKDLVFNKLGKVFFQDIADDDWQARDYFENILYYVYIAYYHSQEYNFIDLNRAMLDNLPSSIAARFALDELPFSLFGNDYILNVLSPSDVKSLRSFFDRYKLPFIRLEPPLFSTGYLPELIELPSFVATISSHHLIWLRKKIAVCISGEFRHVVHRTPEHHVRHIAGFLTGVDCDVYVHGWSNANEALIIDVLKPRAFKFEQRPSFTSLARRITVVEPNIKPGRDEGSLAMFYGIEQATKLMEENAHEYDYVLRIRPDIYSDLSLKEILVKISDEGDFLPNAIYFPKQFHSKGINDQIALGRVEQMNIYSSTFSYIKSNIESLVFNPETILLRHLLDSRVELALVDMPYALMREIPFRIGTITERLSAQFHTWWSRTEELPAFQDLSAFFQDKLRAMESIMRKTLPDLIYIRAPFSSASGGDADGHAVVRAKVFDNDPSRPAFGLFSRFGIWRIAPFVLKDGRIQRTDKPYPRQLFIFPDGDKVVASEWRSYAGKLINNVVLANIGDFSPVARPWGIRMKLAFYLERRANRREEARNRRRDRPMKWYLMR